MRVAVALLIGTMLMSQPAAAEGIASLFGLGGDDKDAIQYLERPPLVVPKGNTLPPPAEFNAKQAAWPRDPDVLAKKRRVLDKKKALKPRNDFDDQLEFIRGEEARVNRRKKLVPGVQREVAETVTASGEPVRQYLTDPPAGLRLPAPAPAPGSN